MSSADDAVPSDALRMPRCASSSVMPMLQHVFRMIIGYPLYQDEPCLSGSRWHARVPSAVCAPQ